MEISIIKTETILSKRREGNMIIEIALGKKFVLNRCEIKVVLTLRTPRACDC